MKMGIILVCCFFRIFEECETMIHWSRRIGNFKIDLFPVLNEERAEESNVISHASKQRHKNNALIDVKPSSRLMDIQNEYRLQINDFNVNKSLTRKIKGSDGGQKSVENSHSVKTRCLIDSEMEETTSFDDEEDESNTVYDLTPDSIEFSDTTSLSVDGQEGNNFLFVDEYLKNSPGICLIRNNVNRNNNMPLFDKAQRNSGDKFSELPRCPFDTTTEQKQLDGSEIEDDYPVYHLESGNLNEETPITSNTVAEYENELKLHDWKFEPHQSGSNEIISHTVSEPVDILSMPFSDISGGVIENTENQNQLISPDVKVPTELPKNSLNIKTFDKIKDELKFLVTSCLSLDEVGKPTEIAKLALYTRKPHEQQSADFIGNIVGKFASQKKSFTTTRKIDLINNNANGPMESYITNASYSIDPSELSATEDSSDIINIIDDDYENIVSSSSRPFQNNGSELHPNVPTDKKNESDTKSNIFSKLFDKYYSQQSSTNKNSSFDIFTHLHNCIEQLVDENSTEYKLCTDKDVLSLIGSDEKSTFHQDRHPSTPYFIKTDNNSCNTAQCKSNPNEFDNLKMESVTTASNCDNRLHPDHCEYQNNNTIRIDGNCGPGFSVPKYANGYDYAPLSPFIFLVPCIPGVYPSAPFLNPMFHSENKNSFPPSFSLNESKKINDIQQLYKSTTGPFQNVQHSNVSNTRSSTNWQGWDSGSIFQNITTKHQHILPLINNYWTKTRPIKPTDPLPYLKIEAPENSLKHNHKQNFNLNSVPLGRFIIDSDYIPDGFYRYSDLKNLKMFGQTRAQTRFTLKKLLDKKKKKISNLLKSGRPEVYQSNVQHLPRNREIKQFPVHIDNYLNMSTKLRDIFSKIKHKQRSVRSKTIDFSTNRIKDKTIGRGIKQNYNINLNRPSKQNKVNKSIAILLRILLLDYLKRPNRKWKLSRFPDWEDEKLIRDLKAFLSKSYEPRTSFYFFVEPHTENRPFLNKMNFHDEYQDKNN